MENLIQRVNQIKDRGDARDLFLIFEGLYERMRSQTLSNAGLVITGAGTTTAKNGNLTYAVANGKLVRIAANTNMAALSGTITANKHNVYVFTVNSAGTLFTQMGTEGTAIGDIVFPTIDDKRAIIGFVRITHTSNFVGGTTALDAAGVTAEFVNTQGAFTTTAATGI